MYISTNIAHTIQVIIDVASIDFKAENNEDGTQTKVAKHQNTCCFFLIYQIDYIFPLSLHFV